MGFANTPNLEGEVPEFGWELLMVRSRRIRGVHACHFRGSPEPDMCSPTGSLGGPRSERGGEAWFLSQVKYGEACYVPVMSITVYPPKHPGAHRPVRRPHNRVRWNPAGIST